MMHKCVHKSSSNCHSIEFLKGINSRDEINPPGWLTFISRDEINRPGCLIFISRDEINRPEWFIFISRDEINRLGL